MQIRVYYEDTDCGNVVYYANYLRYMERSRTEYLRERGIDLAAWHAKDRLFAVIEANIRYKAPAHYNDLLQADSSVLEITPTTILFRTEIKNGQGALLVTGDVRVACITTAGRPTRLPGEIAEVLK